MKPGSGASSELRAVADLTVLGLWDGHESGVALMQDGALRFALNEERLSRRKRASGFPHLALKAGLDHCGIGPDLACRRREISERLLA